MNTGLLEEQCSRDLGPVDDYGRPTTYLSFMVLKIVFSQPQRWFTSKELARLLAARHADIQAFCRQLQMMDLLSEDPVEPDRYHYNLESKSVNLQVRFEKYLMDVEIENLPIYYTLDYSPSFRRPGYSPLPQRD